MKRLGFIGLVLLLVGCQERGEFAAAEADKEMEDMPASAAPPAPSMMERKVGRSSKGRRARPKKKKMAKMDGMLGKGGGGLASMEEAPMEVEGEPEPDDAAPAATRSWFPETFLFEPMVATDASGHASVPVTVPDRLTTWRILALAHSREGAQAGTVASYLGTLPTYVDPIVPPFLMAKDSVDIPIQVVNTTAKRIVRTLRVEASGSASASAVGPIELAPHGSAVKYVRVKANRPGTVTLRASLGDKDAVEKTFAVLPTGRPMSKNSGGTLAAPRVLEISLPGDLEPESATVRLQVFPGALSILRSELGGASRRGGVSDDAYVLLLAGRAPQLMKMLGGQTDPKALRKLSIIAGQRVIRHGRSPSAATAVLLAEAALAHPDNPVLSRLGERLTMQVAQAQRPDGTFQGGTGWTLQRLLVTTADSLRAVRAADTTPKARQRGIGATLRANGAFERNITRVEDAYTAAAILASGGVEGSLADRLRERVRKAIKKNDDGSRLMPVEAGVVRAAGGVPSMMEATALAVLALQADPKATEIIPDLGATLLAGYRPSHGWGDGLTNLVALRAVLQIFKDPLPARVEVTLALDGETIVRGDLAGDRLKDVLTLEAPTPRASGKHTWNIRAKPPVPGLGFSMTNKYYVPWRAEEASQGLELSIDVGKKAQVGRPLDVVLQAVTPAGMAIEVRQALPAGVQPDSRSLEALVSDGTILSHRFEDGTVVLEAPSRSPGQTFTARYRVIPTLAGVLNTSASSVAPVDQPEKTFFVPPSVWKIQ